MPAVKMNVVDEHDGTPIPGLVALFSGTASEGTRTGHGGRSRLLFAVEAVSNESGELHFPKQDFNSQPFSRRRDRRIHRDEEQSLLEACLTMNSAEHKWTGPAMHDRIIGGLETCCRQGEMLRIQNRDVDWTQHQILIRAENAKDNENRRILFDSKGGLAPA